MKDIDTENLYKNALKLHKEKNYEIAKKKYEEILSINPNHVNSLNNLGIILSTQKKYSNAINLFKKVINIDSKNKEALNNLGLSLFNLKNFHEAEICFLKILKIEKNINTLNNLAIVFKEQKKYQKSIAALKQAIEISPNSFQLYNNLGTILMSMKNFEEAIIYFKKSIKIKPNYVDVLNNIGIAYFNLRNFVKSVEFFEKSISIDQNNFKSLYNFANVLKELSRFDESISFYKKAININPKFADALNNLGLVLIQLKKFDEAINYLNKSLQLKKNTEVFNNLLSVYVFLGDYIKAIKIYDVIESEKKSNLVTQFLSMNIFPTIYDSSEQIEIFRKRFKFFINKINEIIDKNENLSHSEILNALKSSTNFYLSYQGRNDLNLQVDYANLIYKLSKKVWPFNKVSKPRIYNNKKIKIGFISGFFYDHTVSRLFKNWIIKLDKNKFEKKIIYIGNKIDIVTKELIRHSQSFIIEENINLLIELIKNENFDVIIYLDIGMNPKIQILASLRFARFQFVTWGHPVTSGLKEIDYFLSSEHMETENSKKYYTEKLICIPGIGIDFDPDIKKISSPKLKKIDENVIYLNHQSLFKMLPKDDHIYLDIIKKNSNCKFWFISGSNGLVTEVFKNRLKNLFLKNNLEFEKYIYFFDKCRREEFLGIINQSDIILDSIDWSGGNSNLEAISLNKPIVTLPSNYLRGRHTYAMLKIMNINETIAKSKENYVDIAVKLAKDLSYRQKIINLIKSNKNKILFDKTSVNFIDDFLSKNLFVNKN